MDRRQFVAGTAAAALAGSSAFAQDAYPTRPITLINPFPPGGAADVVGRPFAAVLEPIIKQPVVIETKAGAAGAVGAQFAAAAKPDGYTLLLHIVSISGFAEMDKLFGRQPKFTRSDFIPIARFTEGPMVLVVNAETPLIWPFVLSQSVMSDGAPCAAKCSAPEISPSFIAEGPATLAHDTLVTGRPAAAACFSMS